MGFNGCLWDFMGFMGFTPGNDQYSHYIGDDYHLVITHYCDLRGLITINGDFMVVTNIAA